MSSLSLAVNPSPTERHRPARVEWFAEFVTRASFESLSPGAVTALKVRFLDSLGVAVGVLDAGPPAIVRRQIKDLDSGAGRSSPDRAALHNGALARYLDFNDSYLALGETCRPSDNPTAVLAAAECAGADGRVLLAALAYQGHVDSLKFAGGSFTLMPERTLREIIEVAHDHDVLVSTGGFLEHVLTRGADAAYRYIEEVTSWRTDVVSQIVSALGTERVMFEAADPEVFGWYVRNYGPEVNFFVDHSQIVQLECLTYPDSGGGSPGGDRGQAGIPA